MSGVSRSMEFEQLGAKLSDLADNLELAEEQIMRLYARYQGTAWDGIVEYPNSFNIRDENADLDFYLKAQVANVSSVTYRREVAIAIAKLVIGEDTEVIADITAELLSVVPEIFSVAEQMVEEIDDDNLSA